MTDKIKHFAVCAAITIIAGYALAPAFGVTLAVTIISEKPTASAVGGIGVCPQGQKEH